MQTASMNTFDVLTETLPIATGPDWGLPVRPGIGVDVDAQLLEVAAANFREHGPLLPYQPDATTSMRA